MKPLYSASTKGFYFIEIHGSAVPNDAVKVTLAEYKRLLGKQSDGYEIVPDTQGRPSSKKVDSKDGE